MQFLHNTLLTCCTQASISAAVWAVRIHLLHICNTVGQLAASGFMVAARQLVHKTAVMMQ